MITPILEKLIFDGKAQYKTFVGGFSQKHIMNIPQNRYIIITDLWYTPTLYFEPGGPDKETAYINHMITQLTIIGIRGFNRFLFKNSIFFNYNTDVLKNNSFTPNNPIHINTFLIHTDGISLTFSNQDDINAVSNAIAPEKVPALTQPSDYGKSGIPGSIPATERLTTSTLYVNDFFNQDVLIGFNGNNEYSFPVNGTTDLPSTLKTESISFPILNIGYVEILGQPNNIGY